jgi:hypothetical protein
MVYAQGLIAADAAGGCGFHRRHRMGGGGQSCLHLFKKDR